MEDRSVPCSCGILRVMEALKGATLLKKLHCWRRSQQKCERKQSRVLTESPGWCSLWEGSSEQNRGGDRGSLCRCGEKGVVCHVSQGGCWGPDNCKMVGMGDAGPDGRGTVVRLYLACLGTQNFLSPHECGLLYLPTDKPYPGCRVESHCQEVVQMGGRPSRNYLSAL